MLLKKQVLGICEITCCDEQLSKLIKIKERTSIHHYERKSNARKL
jgi:hypothetical protein